MVTVSVNPGPAHAARFEAADRRPWSVRGQGNMRAVRSAPSGCVRGAQHAAERALNPRTPVTSPTPAATARMTNRNFAREARASRRATL